MQTVTWNTLHFKNVSHVQKTKNPSIKRLRNQGCLKNPLQPSPTFSGIQQTLIRGGKTLGLLGAALSAFLAYQQYKALDHLPQETVAYRSQMRYNTEKLQGLLGFEAQYPELFQGQFKALKQELLLQSLRDFHVALLDYRKARHFDVSQTLLTQTFQAFENPASITESDMALSIQVIQKFPQHENTEETRRVFHQWVDDFMTKRGVEKEAQTLLKDTADRFLKEVATLREQTQDGMNTVIFWILMTVGGLSLREVLTPFTKHRGTIAPNQNA